MLFFFLLLAISNISNISMFFIRFYTGSIHAAQNTLDSGSILLFCSYKSMKNSKIDHLTLHTLNFPKSLIFSMAFLFLFKKCAKIHDFVRRSKLKPFSIFHSHFFYFVFFFVSTISIRILYPKTTKQNCISHEFLNWPWFFSMILFCSSLNRCLWSNFGEKRIYFSFICVLCWFCFLFLYHIRVIPIQSWNTYDNVNKIKAFISHRNKGSG